MSSLAQVSENCNMECVADSHPKEVDLVSIETTQMQLSLEARMVPEVKSDDQVRPDQLLLLTNDSLLAWAKTADPELLSQLRERLSGWLKETLVCERLAGEPREPMLTESESRFVLAFERQELYNWGKLQESSRWTMQEIDFSQDYKDFQTLPLPLQQCTKLTLGFLASADGVVLENLSTNFAEEVQWPEVRYTYAQISQVEAVHQETYTAALESVVPDLEERARLLSSMVTVPSIRAKVQWARKYMSRDQPFRVRLAAFGMVEGIMFSFSFNLFYFFKKCGKMPGSTFANELISRDEGLHQQWSCVLHSYLLRQCEPELLRRMVAENVELECAFVDEALPQPILGLNADMLKQYVKFVADGHLALLRLEPLYRLPNPCNYMTMLGLEGKTNFFEKRVGEYQQAKGGEFSLTADI